jgi:hypothetical protein
MIDLIDPTQEIIETLKVRDISGKMNFPQIKLTIYDKESVSLTNEIIFGNQIGNKYPYFLFNINFNVISNIGIFIIKIPIKVLLENILLLNTLWKKNNNEKNLITEEDQIKQLINYISSRFRIKNALYDFFHKYFLKNL